MQAERFDAVVIGSGQAGPALAARLDQAGRRTALIERHLIGGTCVNTGCIPTKTLIASARAAQMARRGAEYGFDAGAVRVDMKAVKARKDGVVGQSSAGLARWIEGMKQVSLIRGHARFTAPRTVAVNGRLLQADQVFINVGGRAAVPDLPGIGGVPYFTNTTMMGVDFVPEHLLIVGGSYIGLEFAQMYRRFGSEVTVIERAPKLLPREDDDVAAEIRAILERDGIALRTNAECMALRANGDRIEVGLSCQQGPPVAVGSHLLLAVGRVPNTDDLDLAAAGVETDARGYIKVDDGCRTSAEGVYALGGMNEAEARASGKRVLAGRMPMARVGRAREAGETQGFMKVLVDADTKLLLGASLLGLNADEVVHSLLDVMVARQPYTTIARAMHIHPTVSELVPTLLQGLKPLAAWRAKGEAPARIGALMHRRQL